MLSQAEVFAISTVIQNYNNRRVHFGFCYADEIEPFAQELMQKQREYSIIPVISDDDNLDSYIIEVEPNYLQKTLIREMPNVLHEGDLQEYIETSEKNKVLFEKFLMEHCDNLAEVIAIYNLNYNNIIEYKGRPIKSFGVVIGDALPLLSEYGYVIKVGNQRLTPQQFYECLVKRNKDVLYAGLRMSPNSRGVFIGIQSTYNTQQKEQMRQIFNRRYKLRQQ